MKITTIGANHLFPEFPLGEEVFNIELGRIATGCPTHYLNFDGVEYLFEIKETVFITKNEFLIDGFIVDDRVPRRFGRIIFKFLA